MNSATFNYLVLAFFGVFVLAVTIAKVMEFVLWMRDKENEQVRKARQRAFIKNVNMYSFDYARTIQLAEKEADRHKQEFVGTEHLLLALLKMNNSDAAKLLNINYQQVREIIDRKPKAGSYEVFYQTFRPELQRVVKRATEFADGNAVTSFHLLAGLLAEEEGMHAVVLKELGVDIMEILK